MAAWIAVLISVFQYVNGSLVIGLYSSILLENLGQSKRYGNFIIYFALLPAQIPVFFMFKHLGRKTNLLIGSWIVNADLLVISFCMYYGWGFTCLIAMTVMIFVL